MKSVPSIVCVVLTVACLFVLSFGLGCNAKMAGAEQSEWQVKTMRVTAYCPCPKCCGKYSDGVTANGHVISNGDRFVAADSRFAFDTQMVIPGYNNGKVVRVFDRGGAIKGDRIDVFFNTHEEALEWGVQYLNVKILNQ
jgi:3D (Asp-Asp-Asp) domain-containing protein